MNKHDSGNKRCMINSALAMHLIGLVNDENTKSLIISAQGVTSLPVLIVCFREFSACNISQIQTPTKHQIVAWKSIKCRKIGIYRLPCYFGTKNTVETY